MPTLPEIKPEFRGEMNPVHTLHRRKPRLAVLVLGMHRSGTSAMAGFISKLGFGLPGDLIEAQDDNQRGFFESNSLMLAHERLLASLGSDWSALDDLSNAANTDAGRVFTAEIRDYLEREFDRSPNLVLKDPRICRLLPLWLPVLEELGADVLPIHVVRNPLAVSASLLARNQFSPGRSLLIWLDHVLRAERHTRGMHRLFLNFDSLLADWRSVMQQLKSAGIITSAPDYTHCIDIETFLSEEIRHHKFQSSDVTGDSTLPEWIREACQIFERAADTSSEPSADKLDLIFLEYEKSRSLFNATIRDHKTRIAQLDADILNLKSEAGQYRNALDVLRKEASEETQRLQEELRQMSGRETALAAAHDVFETQVALLKRELKEATDREAILAAAHRAFEAEVSGLKRELREGAENLSRLMRENAVLGDVLGNLHAELDTLKGVKEQLQAKTEEAGSLQRALTAQGEETVRQRKRSDELSNYNEHLQQLVRQNEAALREMRGSTFWRMTAPLRRLVSGLRQLRRKRSHPLARLPIDRDSSEHHGRADFSRPLVDAPATPSVRIAPRQAPVDIIIPVYRGLETTAACIESVLATHPGVDHELVIIDDCSPQPEVSAYIASLAGRPGITVLRNEQNLGFVGTVNRGMALHPDRDVVLLNSDTEVAGDWLRRLVMAAYSDVKVSSVTPFSNNATICSYPRFCEENALADGLTLEQIDALFAEANASQTVDIPTAVGFCMFIRRDCLDAVGAFDEEAFGKGYGEENDFCLRASAHGWRHLLAADTFVFHKGGVSFAETALAQQAKAAEIIRGRWPDYFDTVARHVSQDPEKPYRIAATALRYKRDARVKILAITHAYGGGVERHIDDLKALNAEQALFLTLRPRGGNIVSIETSSTDGVKAEFDLVLEGERLAALLADFGVSRVHIHHVLHFGEGLKPFIGRLGLPFDFTIHDYFTVCPRIHLGGTESSYCGEPNDAACNACIKRDNPVYDRSITDFRTMQAWLLNDAARVIAPSHDTANRIRRYFPSAEIRVVPHVSDRVGTFESALPSISPEERFRVLMLGVVAPHKGLAKLTGLIGTIEAAGAPVEVHLLGSIQGEPQALSAHFFDHGPYQDEDLSELIAEIDPHLIWFPAQVPETFSYTMEAALASGRPIAASDLGAFPERLAGRDWSAIWPWHADPTEILSRMLEMREAMLVGRPMAQSPRTLPPLVHEGFYQIDYLAGATARPANRRRVVAVDFPVIPTACGQIRVVSPLSHPYIANDVALEILPYDEAVRAKTDAILVQRNAVPTIEAANRLADHCDRNGIRKIFEIDDDLFALPDDHPEKAVYENQLLGAKAFMERADRIVVTTEVLAERMRAFNPAVTVVPNMLDDRLWFTGGKGAPRPRKPGEKLRVAFVGSSTHGADLAMIAPAMQEVLRRRPGMVEFHMVGGTFGTAAGLPEIIRHPPPELAGHYVRFVDWLRRSADWHVGLAPLVPSMFNAAKSPLKYLDYSALGLAGIYSAGAPFEGVVDDGKTGLLATDLSGWTDALIRLIDDDELRLDLARAARADIRRHYTLAANSATLRDVWIDLIDG